MWELLRVQKNNNSIFGTLSDTEHTFCTLERPEIGNINEISCIPVGTYVCRKVNSQKFGWTFEVTGITDRDSVLFHNGCEEHDTHGCILLGLRTGQIGGEFAVLDSRPAFIEFMVANEDVQEFDLYIDEV